MRIFRLLKNYGRVVLDTLLNILPQITNIMGMIFLLLFIYSVLGISLFADVKYGDNYNQDNNFRTFPKSIVLLFRWMTGEDWNLIMDDLASTTDCLSSQTYRETKDDGVLGCGSWYAYLYFISFMILMQMVIINLTVAAVIDGLSSARKDNAAVIKKDEINELIELWAEYDPKATGWIEVTDLWFLLFELPKPMGYEQDRDLIYKADNSNAEAAPKLDITNILKENSVKREKMKEILKHGRNIELDSSGSICKDDTHQRIQHLETIKPDTSLNVVIQAERNLLLRKVETIKILEHFDIPYYENKKVHFKDICKKVVDNTFKSMNQEVEVGKRLKKRIKRGWDKKYNMKKHKRINIQIQKIMAATVLLKWVRFYRRKKAERGEQISQSFVEFEEKMSQSILNSISGVKDPEQLSHLDSFEGSIHKAEESKSQFSRFPKHKRDSKLSSEYNKFIENNPEYFQSLKVSDKHLDKYKHNFLLGSIGGFFEKHGRLSRKQKLKTLEAKKDQIMRSTNAFKHRYRKKEMSFGMEEDSNEDRYSYQQVNTYKLDLD